MKNSISDHDNRWKTYKLRDCILQLNTGLNPRDNFSLGNGEIKYITAKNLTREGYIDFSGCDYVDSKAKAIIHRRSDIQIGDILFSSRAPIGNCHYIKETTDFYEIGESIFSIRVKKEIILPEYLCLYFSSDYFIKAASKRVTGSVIKEIRISDLLNMDIVVPEQDIQKQIADCIGNIDNKIEMNKSISIDLEAMAKLLYDYWFVQFDFPDKNGKPYKSSGGKMVWNEQLKREIPEKWEVKKLSDIAVYSEDRVSASSLTQTNYIGIDNLLPEMKGRTESEYTPDTGNTVGFGKGDILLGNIRPYFKKIWLSDIQGGCSPDVLVIRSIAGNDTEFIFASLAKDDFFTFDMAGKKGSKMPRGDKDHIMRYPIAYTKDHVLQFCAIVRDWYKDISEIYYENQQLSSMRDFLLPLLMNGQVRVDNNQ